MNTEKHTRASAALQRLLKRFVGFTLVGAVGTTGHYTVLLLLVEVLGIEVVTASVAGFIVGGVINYTLNRRLVFRSQRAHGEALPRFFAVAGVGLVGNALLMSLLTYRWGIHYVVAQLVTTAVLLVWHFTANALWTFRDPRVARR